MNAPRVAVVTAARDEEANLPRLIEAMASQDLTPVRWTIVDTGSSDATLQIAFDAAERYAWIEVASAPATRCDRGAPIVRAIELTASRLSENPPELLVNIDADVSFDPHFLRALSIAFDVDPKLGIASGTCYEQIDGAWHERFVTGTGAWGATRAYRWDCLTAVRPLESRSGWDCIDALRAQSRGWSTCTLRDLPFRHHRAEGSSDPRWRAFAAQGATAHFMGYRHSYLLLRALHHARRHPAALAMYAAYLGCALARKVRLDDEEAREYLRRGQTLRQIEQRSRKARGAAASSRRSRSTAGL